MKFFMTDLNLQAQTYANVHYRIICLFSGVCNHYNFPLNVLPYVEEEISYI